MTDQNPPPAPAPASDKLARLRFFVIGLFRLIGGLLVLAGFAIIAGGLVITGTDQDRVIGVMLVLFGVFEFAIMPLILARRWRTPRA
jgi:uncharacterized membrane protein YhaH (DUF805 family)